MLARIDPRFTVVRISHAQTVVVISSFTVDTSVMTDFRTGACLIRIAVSSSFFMELDPNITYKVFLHK